MSKLFWFKFTPADWRHDTGCLSPATKGVWIDLLCTLWPVGIKTMPESNWCRELGATEAEFLAAIQELTCFDVAKISRVSNGDVTVESRRMAREAKAREHTRLRVSRHRATVVVTPSKRSGSGTELELELKEDKNKTIAAIRSIEQTALFWSAYKSNQRKVGRGMVEKWFEKNAVPDEVFAAILTSLQNLAVSDKWLEEGGRWIPSPMTWLNQKRWLDDVPLSRKKDRIPV